MHACMHGPVLTAPPEFHFLYDGYYEAYPSQHPFNNVLQLGTRNIFLKSGTN